MRSLERDTLSKWNGPFMMMIEGREGSISWSLVFHRKNLY